jgi:hypothetical protein
MMTRHAGMHLISDKHQSQGLVPVKWRPLVQGKRRDVPNPTEPVEITSTPDET